MNILKNKYPQIVSDTGSGRRMRCNEALLLKNCEYYGYRSTTPDIFFYLFNLAELWPSALLFHSAIENKRINT